MCGRFTLTAPKNIVAEVFGIADEAIADLSTRYNIAPSQPILAVRSARDGHREAVMLRWGLLPAWARDPAIGNRMINARAETIADKPAYAPALRQRRCLIVADGFYEWAPASHGRRKQPYLIRRNDRRPFAMAGLWERWMPAGDASAETIETCTIVTTTANQLLKPIHDRMPVILARTDFERWLDRRLRDLETLESMLRPYRNDDMEAIAVSTYVNTPSNDDARCLEPLTADAPAE